MKKTISAFLSAFLFFIITLLPAQNEASKWYFGRYAGLDFMTNPPTILTNDSMVAPEGCASIADGTGNLLFYTNGDSIWDQTNNIMPNGTGLMGNFSATQSSIIVKQPGNAYIYYVFTIAEEGSVNGLRYSVIDMSLSGGTGSVTTKNILLHTPTCEKITSVKHNNGVDIWIASHDLNSNTFRAFLLTASGINPAPVLSAVGYSVTSPLNTLGAMKFSPNGQKLGVAYYDPFAPGPAELYDFNSSNGMIYNPVTLTSVLRFYGCEFSPDGNKFYADCSPSAYKILQWNLSAGTASAIIASCFTVSTGNVELGTLQLSINGKIYVARYGQTTLGVINNPNTGGVGCNYVDFGQFISPNKSKLGLPNFMVSNFKQHASFTYSMNCSIASFTAPLSSDSSAACSGTALAYTSYSWDFGDPATGINNTSSSANPTHAFSTGGTYIVRLIATSPCATDTLTRIVSTLPNVTLGGKKYICRGESTYLTAGGAASYTWSYPISNIASVYVSPTVTTTYSVTGTSSVCFSTKTITVNVDVCTGIEQLSNGSPLPVFPNPFSSELHLELQEPTKLLLYKASGELVMEKQLQKNKNNLNTSELSSGIYILKLISANGMKISRLIKTD